MRNIKWIKPLVVIITMALTVAIFVILIAYKSEEDYQKRVSQTELFAEKNIRETAVFVDETWKRLDFVIRRMESENFENIDSAISFLCSVRDDFEKDDFDLYVICSNKYFSGTDNKAGWWSVSTMQSFFDNKQLTVKSVLATEDQRLVFLMNAPKAIPFTDDNWSDTPITQVAIICDLNNIAGAITGQNDVEVSEYHLVDKTGNKIYSSDSKSFVLPGFSIKKDLDNIELNEDLVADDILNAMEYGNSGTFSCRTNDTEYIIPYVPLDSGNWYMFTVIREDSVPIGRSFALWVVFLCFIVFIVLLIALIMFLLHANNFSVSRHEQESKDAIRTANISKSKFLSNMSHDIRTPLNTIIGMTKMISDAPNDSATVNDCAERISFYTKNLLSLVNDTLELARLEAGKTELVREPINLIKVVNESRDVLNEYASERRLNIEYSGDPSENADVLGDAAHIRQLLENLFCNAVNITADDGYIKLDFKLVPGKSKDKTSAVITIADSGKGMEQKYLDRIFSPSADEEVNLFDAEYHGNGLGLSIVKQLSDAMGGTITIASEPNIGTSFTVTLPFDLNPNPGTDIEEDEDPDEDENPDYSDLYALFVEDNAMNREISMYFFNKYNLRVDVAEDGQIAVDMFRTSAPGKYDFILMDIMMPNMDGYEATRIIRAMNRSDAKKVPIIAMTANAFADDVSKALAAGMDEYLSKPIEQKKLIKIINRIEEQIIK